MVDSYDQLADAWSAYYTIHKKGTEALGNGASFDKPRFLGPLGLHAIKKGCSTYLFFNLSKLKLNLELNMAQGIARFFFDIVNSSHTFATGDSSTTMEHWHDLKRLVDEIEISSNEETCATYDLLKISQNLFRWTKEIKYANGRPLRVLINGVMGNRRRTKAARCHDLFSSVLLSDRYRL
ncbi:hypothetical protein GUJ93_ZPchr0006g40872 [Zizania palustris]|uniref:Non-reducing end beta-L-arabinofuranosidase-like GH127 catalytic domain-containing protein n=1 Tax=Zizania palustris TaxID=103762 RepID=A0A8J5T1A1_ZIZPA|nr:hypothetical protein GUJ93_ZPchr0006g40872 [Zizania palustris]